MVHVDALDRWRALLDLDRAALLARVGASEDDVVRDVGYEGMPGLDRVQESDGAYAFLDGDRVAIVYAGRAAFGGASAGELARELDGVGHELRSRAGKRAVQHVYPERGVAFSAEDDEVQFVEVFPPTTLERYRNEIYDEPGPFTQ